MNKKFLMMLGMAAAFTLPAGTVKLQTVDASNGVLVDKDNDGVVDEAISARPEITMGKIWGANYKAVFEFQLPENLGKVTSAKLLLFPNGPDGCYPEIPGTNGPESWIYYYLAPEANGKVELTDDDGEKLQVRIPDKPLAKPIKAFELNVTPALEAAQAARSKWVGLRVEASPKESNTGKAWRFRTAKFGEMYGKIFAPTLVIETE